MKSRIFWKLFTPFAILNVVAVCGALLVSPSGDGEMSAAVGPLFLLLSLLTCTAWIAAYRIRPILALLSSANRIGDGDLGTPVYVGTQDELGQLGTSLNAMRGELVGRTAEINRLSTVLAAMTSGVISIDADQQVLFANASAGRMLDFNPSEARGRPLLESVRSHRLHELATRLLASKGKDELEIQWGDDNPRSLFVNGTYFVDEISSGVIMLLNNLSEIRHLETMRRDFVANVSHELKTPLSSIKAYAETLSQGAINDVKNRDRFVQNIEEQADRLNQLISDLLSLARIEQGKSLMEIRQVPLERIFRLCIEDQQRAADKKNINLETLVETVDIRATVQADEDGLRQILINLIDNAIKYTPSEGTVTLGWFQSADTVEIFVRDTGIGIPKEMQERVFERFFRVDKARSREVGGTGLGLAIVKHLSQSFGGSVEVTGEPGEGSCFTVRLPRGTEHNGEILSIATPDT